MKKHRINLAVSGMALYGLLFTFSANAAVTDIATKPLKANVLVKPNVILGVDDSGSMDTETMLYTNDGALWWDYTNKTGWGKDATHPNAAYRDIVSPWFNGAGAAGTQWRKMTYLFPNGSGASTGRRSQVDGSYESFAVMPTTEFAFLRSSAYNPMYYDPMVKYDPWAPAYRPSTSANITPAAASTSTTLAHPLYPTGSTFNLTAATAVNTNDNYVFTAFPGMTLPADAGGKVQKKECSSTNGSCAATWTNVTVQAAATASKVTRVAMEYHAATYWVPETCTVPTTINVLTDTCTKAYDGKTLKRYEIKGSNTYPSGRSTADELQNFANWFQYFRKRRLMLSASVGDVMETLTGMRIGVVMYNGRTTPLMYDTDDTLSSKNGRAVAGKIYETFNGGGTPTRETLDFIGKAFAGNDSASKSIVQYACQRNAGFIMTDGFANASAVTMPAYQTGKSAADWGTGAPYETIHAGSIADIALRLYTNNPKTSLSKGALTETERDKNTDLHVNTYGLTLGAKGTLYFGDDSVVPTDVAAWPKPDKDRSPTSVDDLWHATINGRGQMYTANTPAETAVQIQNGLNDIIGETGAQSAVSVSSVNLSTSDGFAYLATYNPAGWSGDITANEISKSTGIIEDEWEWSASEELIEKDWTTRVIATHNGTSAMAFTETNVGSTVNPSNAWGATADVINYLRGDRSGEGTSFRQRTSLLGAVINARPVVSDGIVYAQSGEGMLHAFDSATGEEKWAYVPHSVLSSIGATSSRSYTFETLLDGSPTVVTTNGTTYLVAGRGSAGDGYYAMDISAPDEMTSESTVASKVLWDINNSGSFKFGASMGKPLVVRTQKYSDQDVVLLTQGYITEGTPDGVGRLYVVKASDGTLLQTMTVTSAASGTDSGLAQISALVGEDGLVKYVYGGDLQGNLWRFDMSAGGTVQRLATLKNGTTIQPITTAPELVVVDGMTIVLVGTGRFLGLTDFGSSATQSFYAIKDSGTDLGDPRSKLQQRTLGEANDDGESSVTGSDFSWSDKSGWYIDLPAGQQVNTDPSLAFGAVVFIANKATMSDCSASSYLYVLDVLDGLLAGEMTWASTELGNVTASQVSLVGTDTQRIVGLYQKSDGSAGEKELDLDLGVQSRKNAWRQVHR